MYKLSQKDIDMITMKRCKNVTAVLDYINWADNLGKDKYYCMTTIQYDLEQLSLQSIKREEELQKTQNIYNECINRRKKL